MKVQAVSKYNRISARKVRLVADMVRGQKAVNAFGILKFTPKKAAKLVEKTLKSAVSNAENNHGLDKKDLVVSTIMVDEGPTLKRHRPRAKGMAGAINKRTAHVTIIVEGSEKAVKKVESAKKTEVKDEKTTRLRKKATDGQEGKKVVKETVEKAAKPEKK